jgi:hypothetical protein
MLLQLRFLSFGLYDAKSKKNIHFDAASALASVRYSNDVAPGGSANLATVSAKLVPVIIIK